jgi:hypothetical protein
VGGEEQWKIRFFISFCACTGPLFSCNISFISLTRVSTAYHDCSKDCVSTVYKYLTISSFFGPNCGCNFCSSAINICKCQNNQEGSKILLTVNMFNIFSLHNFGSTLFLTNMRI